MLPIMLFKSIKISRVPVRFVSFGRSVNILFNKVSIVVILVLCSSTVQSASIPDNNLTKDEQRALTRLKNDESIVILPADKGRVTVVMDKSDFFAKMDALVNSTRRQLFNENLTAIQCLLYKIQSLTSLLFCSFIPP